MPAEFTGEQKLRIILESIIRGVSREEQCKKYGISEEEFQAWHDHLTKNGGQIFEANPRSSRYSRTRKIKYTPWWVKTFLTLSILANLVALLFLAFLSFPEKLNFISPLTKEFTLDPVLTVGQEANQSSKSVLAPTPDLEELMTQVEKLGNIEDTSDLPLLPAPDKPTSRQLLDELIQPALKQPIEPSLIELNHQVEFLDQTFEAKHVVYLIDAGSYQLKGRQSAERLEKIKVSVLNSLTKLTPNSFFNIVLCWNLREAHALGKTILRANEENINYASEWILSLGSTPDSLKEGRNQFYPKELLYARVLPGVVGPWYGLATAISYDPDVVFFLAGNMPDFSPDEVSSNDYNGLGIKQNSRASNVPELNSSVEDMSSLIRKTAGLWLVSLQSEQNLPAETEKIEEIAMQRLGLDSIKPEHISQKFSIPWDKAFDNFLAGLELGYSKIPQVHVFQTLPEHMVWPTSLQKSMEEFCESTRGSLREFR